MSDNLLPERHFIHYANGEYERNESYYEIQCLAARYLSKYPDSISGIEVLTVVCDVVYPYLSREIFENIIKSFFTNENFNAYQKSILNEVCQMLISISLKYPIKVTAENKALINLGEPDPTILPLQK